MNSIASGINKHADLILTVAGVAGLVSTVVLAVKETPQAIDILDDSRYRLDRIDRALADGKINPGDAEDEAKAVKKATAKDLAINYIPAGISFAITVGCIVGSNKVSRSRNAALSSLLNATNIAYSEYRDRVRTSIGETKEKVIHDEIRKEHIDQLHMKKTEQVYNTGKGDTLCHIELVPGDASTGIYFLSSPEAIHAAINQANAEGIESSYVSMHDLLYFMGLNIHSHGTDLFGWQIHSRSELITTRESSHVHDETGKPVLDIDFYNPPYTGYDRFG